MLSARPTPAVAGSYLGGSILGALTSASVLLVAGGLLSPIPPQVRAGALVLAVAALAIRAVGLVRFRLPQNSRQIAQDVFRAKPTSAAFRFSFELGTSVRTYITKEAPYAAALLVLLALPSTLGSGLLSAALLAVGFGVGRAWIVATQQFGQAMIVEHPDWAFTTANLAALVGAAGVGITSW